MTRILLIPLIAALLAAAPPGRETVIGEAGAISPAHHSIAVNKDDNGAITVTFDEKTVFLRALPGASTLEGATPVQAADIKAGDRLLCRGTFDAAGTTLAANRVVVMTRDDVESRRKKEQEDWQKRGVAGVVTAIDGATQEITLRSTQGGATKPVVVEAGRAGVSFRRYAPTSVRYADARPGTFTEIAVGDQLRVLGDRNAEGTRLTAEKIVSGAFRVVRGTVTGIDAASGTVSIREGARGPAVAVSVGADTVLRRLPTMMVMRLLRSTEGATDSGGPAGGWQGVGTTPGAAGRTGAPAGAAPAAPGMRGAGRPADPDEALERLPAIRVADIVKGEEIAVLGPKQAGEVMPAIKAAVWTQPQLPSGDFRSGGRGQGGMGMGADPFSDVLGMAGESSW